MMRFIGGAAVVVALASGSAARAQFGGGFGYAGGYGYGGGIGFSYHRHGLRVGGFAGGYYSRSVFFGSGYGFGPFSPFSPFSPLGFGPPLGWNPVWGGWGPPVVVVPQFVVPPFALAGNAGPNGPEFDPPPQPAPAVAAGGIAKPPANDPAPVGPRDNFLVIAPRKDFPPAGGVLPAVERVAVPPPRPVFRFDPFAAPVPVRAERPEADPVREAARLMRLGRAAFAAGEYGAAGEQFDRAILANPKAAEPHFLKAQAAVAAGGYAEAVAAIRAGLDLDPAWPAGAFDPKEPYGANPAAFAGHLAALRRVAAANPGEASLEFLLGCELWFVGERAEAKKWFAAAEKRLAAPGPIALFK